MNNSNYAKRTTYNCYENEKQSHTEKSTADSVHTKVPSMPAPTVKPVVSQKTKIPPPFACPKHMKASFVPPLSTRPGAQQKVALKNTPSPADTKNVSQVVPPTKTVPSTVIPLKANHSKVACNDQWWLKYDEYLGKILK